jgi:hypothetical protein
VADLPTGTVTFLFTDLEVSTRCVPSKAPSSNSASIPSRFGPFSGGGCAAQAHITAVANSFLGCVREATEGAPFTAAGRLIPPNNARASFRQTRPASTVSVLLVSASIHWPGSSERSTATTASATADIGGATSVTTKVLERTLAARQLVDE